VRAHARACDTGCACDLRMGSTRATDAKRVGATHGHAHVIYWSTPVGSKAMVLSMAALACVRSSTMLRIVFGVRRSNLYRE
jgi:hypothetical protein